MEGLAGVYSAEAAAGCYGCWSGVVDPSRPTGASVILAAPEDRAILTAVGTIDALDVDALPAELLHRARHVHVGSYFFQRTSRDRLPAFFRAVQEAGLTTSFDCNWDPTERWDGGIDALLPVSDVFFPNAVEAMRLARLDDAEAAARELARRGASTRVERRPWLAGWLGGRAGASRDPGDPAPGDLIVAVKCGADGALVVHGGDLLRLPALSVKPVDTTGAGDSFDAGFLYGWLAGWSLREALRLGVACGSLSTEHVGGTAGQPTLEQAQAALAAWRA